MSRSPETLGDYRALALLAGWEKAVKYLDTRIASAPGGARDPVLADGSQMVNVLFALEGIGPVTKVPQAKPVETPIVRQ